jgi:hypothetical protein
MGVVGHFRYIFVKNKGFNRGDEGWGFPNLRSDGWVFNNNYICEIMYNWLRNWCFTNTNGLSLLLIEYIFFTINYIKWI